MKSLWILSEQRRLEVQKTLDTLTQTSGYNNYCFNGPPEPENTPPRHRAADVVPD
jgi:hypothetical protein